MYQKTKNGRIFAEENECRALSKRKRETMHLKPKNLSNFNVADVCYNHIVPSRFPLNHIVGHLRADSQTAQAATKVLQSR